MNKLDFDDARERGAKKGRERAKRILEQWNRIENEIAIGQMLERIKANPELMARQDPKVMAEMEARYGESS